MDTAHLKALLEEETQRLEKQMHSVGRPNLAVPGDWEPVPSETGTEPDLVDQADVIVSREENTAILADLEARYGQVREALARIESGSYGVCDGGNKPTEEGPLAA